nr:CpsB/CapC family capsule biosynthesis tyrosine phosphatase [Paracholeplasma brassicae]
MSIEMIKKQINDGVTTVVLTPHMRSFKPEKVSKIRHNFEQLKEKVKEQNLDVRLLLGSEVYYTKESLSNKHLMTIENTSYVLVEFSTILETPIEEIVYNFRTLKIRPIVAHVERYGYLKKKDYTEIKKTGGLIQVNSSAILGLDGYKRKKWRAIY